MSALVLSARIIVAGNCKKSLTVAELLGLEDCSISALNCTIPLANVQFKHVEQLPVLKFNSNQQRLL